MALERRDERFEVVKKEWRKTYTPLSEIIIANSGWRDGGRSLGEYRDVSMC